MESTFRLTLLVGSGGVANATFASTLNDGFGAVSVTPAAHTANGRLYHPYDISSGTTDIACHKGGDTVGILSPILSSCHGEMLGALYIHFTHSAARVVYTLKCLIEVMKEANQ